jgi:hypothetical protein
MKVSKKNYVAISKILYNHRDEVTASGIYGNIAEDLADYFKADNSDFDRSRFLEACGLSASCG